MNAAQPFMLIVVQIGSTKRVTRRSRRRFCSAEASVTGSVPAELFEKRATASAGNMPFRTRSGLIRRARRKSGSTTKNCSRLPVTTTATYLPREPTITPASIWEDSWPAKARIPTGRMKRSARISVKRSSWSPKITRSRESRPSVRGMKARARPTATAITRTESTLPSRKGCRTLSGTTDRKWS